ncbi:MAG: penicillin-binding transpeptidase domain-containing protein [Acidimicrobiales bacterium]
MISKTGTAQKNGRVDTALFVACGPDPRSTICLGTVIEESGYGGTVAAPVLRRILEPIAGQETTAGQRPQLAEGTD